MLLKWGILTIFPEIFEGYIQESILKRAVEKKIVEFEFVNIRDFTIDKHRTVDDKPYGGGAGMLMMAEPVIKAHKFLLNRWKQEGIDSIITVIFEAKGKVLTQEFLKALVEKRVLYLQKEGKTLGIVCIVPRYEGIDARVYNLVDYVISIGPYILTGAELPALVFIDALTRLLPGVLGNKESLAEESSFTVVRGEKVHIKKEYPQFTRPRVVEIYGKKYKVPEVLLRGDHAAVDKWRKTHVQRSSLKFLSVEDV